MMDRVLFGLPFARCYIDDIVVSGMEQFILKALTTFGDRLQSAEERGVESTP